MSWLAEDVEAPIQVESPIEEDASLTTSPTSPTKAPPPALPAPRKLKKRELSKGSTPTTGPYITSHLESARQSSLSMMEMAAQKEKPGVITPSRTSSLKHGLRQAIMNKKEKPPVPKARRSGLSRMKIGPRSETSAAVAQVGQVELLADAEKGKEDGRPDLGSEDQSPTTSASPTALENTRRDSETAKKPPPAPKARRWRGKRTKEEDESGGRSSDPKPQSERGRFTTNLPSIITTSPVKAQVLPFSVVEEKTLNPEMGFDGVNEADNVGPAGHKSVHAALGQAQRQAVSGLEETLERTHLFDDLTPSATGTGTERARRAVLAPPGMAPGRGVPGPKWELERSPFLTDEEEADVDVDDGGSAVEHARFLKVEEDGMK